MLLYPKIKSNFTKIHVDIILRTNYIYETNYNKIDTGYNVRGYDIDASKNFAPVTMHLSHLGNHFKRCIIKRC